MRSASASVRVCGFIRVRQFTCRRQQVSVNLPESACTPVKLCSVFTCRNQDTVGDLSRDQVKAALDRQLKFAASKKGQQSDSNSNEQAPAA